MTSYKPGDRARAKRDLKDGKIPRGSEGTAVSNSPSSIAMVRIRFDNDPGYHYRIVAKSDLRKLT